MRRLYGLAITVMLIFLGTFDVKAQFNIQHQAPTVIVNGEETVLEFLVPGITQDQIASATLFSRTDGDLSYNQQESLLQNGIFTFRIRVDEASANTFEYYFVIQLVDGSLLTFPESNYTENPVQVPVVGEEQEVEEETFEPLTGVEYTILSPEEGLAYGQDDMVLAVALFYDPALIEPGEFKIFLDNKDVTADADTSTYFLSYAPGKIRMGSHTFAIDYVTESTRYRLSSWSFNVVDPSLASFSGFTERKMPRGNVELTARNQVIAGDVNDALTGLVRVSGSQGYLNYSVNGFLTSQESSRLQPQNRFGINLNYGKWLNLQGGHIFPTVSNLSMNGRRVFGLNTSVHLADENLNFQFLFGELSREVSNRYGSLNRSEVTAPDGSVVDTTYTLTFENQGQGTFRRQIIGGRVGFGNSDRFQFGIHALKVQDDTSSISNIGDFNELQTLRSDLLGSLSGADIAKLNSQPDIVQVQGGNPRARGNLVAGTDLRFNMDQNRIRFNGEISAGVLNNDISGGALTVERADELGFEIDQADADLLERLSRFIIINENMSNLPLRISQNEQGNNETEFFFPTAVLAGNSQASFNYLNNNLRVQYQWIGPDYTSLANNTIRRDVAGFTISDRIRMLENRLFLTLGFESLDDNVVGNLEATTTTNTIRTNLSWYPVDRLLPRMSIGIRLRNRDNGVNRFNPNVNDDLLTASVQNFQIVNGDTLGAAVARSNNTFNFNSSISKQFDALQSRHDISLNLNTLRTQDDVFEFGDTRSFSLSLNLNSRFSQMPLNTQLGMSINNTETTSGLSDFKIFGLFAGGTYFLLEDRLSINGQIAITNNINRNQSLRINDNGTANFSGDDFYESDPNQIQRNEFSTFVFRTGAEFTIDQNQALIFDANFNNVSLAGTANDRIVQLRYVFRF